MAWASPWQVVRAMRMAQGAAWASGTVIGVCTCAGEARVEHKSCHQLADGVPLPACGEPGVIVMPEHATRTLPSGLAAYEEGCHHPSERFPSISKDVEG